jgi:hypothetical protein
MSSLFKDISEGKKVQGGTADKLRIHIRILQTLSNFVYESTKFDIVTEEWE